MLLRVAIKRFCCTSFATCVRYAKCTAELVLLLGEGLDDMHAELRAQGLTA